MYIFARTGRYGLNTVPLNRKENQINITMTLMTSGKQSDGRRIYSTLSRAQSVMDADSII